MSATNEPRAVVLVNARAGQGSRAVRGAQEAARVWAQAGWQVELRAPSGREAMRAAARRAALEAVQVVLVAGGDGSYRLVAEGLFGTGTALAPLPLGSRSVLAQALGAPRPGPGWPWRWPRWLRRLAHGRAQPYPVARVNGQLFLSWAGWGFDAAVVHAVEAARQGPRGWVLLRYSVAIARVLRTWSGFYRHDAPQGPWWMGLVYHQPRYAGGLIRLPEPTPNAPWRVLWVPGQGLQGFKQALRAWLGYRFRGADPTRALSEQGHTWSWDRPIPLHLDGDPAGKTTHVHWAPEPAPLLLWTA
ncbi:MAG: hypothetical protein GXO36_02345 [Chloroflexi bacterium]|nr:hypothetical protein [Chloroflexota bacterium]